jgi:hypothetical protein
MMTPTRSGSRATWERLDLLRDLRRQLPRTGGPLRAQTMRAIQRLELETAPSRAAADAAQRQLDLEQAGGTGGAR